MTINVKYSFGIYTTGLYYAVLCGKQVRVTLVCAYYQALTAIYTKDKNGKVDIVI